MASILPGKISDCCRAGMRNDGIMIASVIRPEFWEDHSRYIRNEGIYCCVCGRPCLVAEAEAVPNSPEISTGSVAVTNPRRGPGCTINLSVYQMIRLMLETDPEFAASVETVVDEVAKKMRGRLAETIDKVLQ